VINGKVLKALPTRDALLPAIMLLAAASNGKCVSELVAECTQRFSASDRIQNFATEKSKQIIAKYTDDADSLIGLLGFEGVAVESVDVTDGLRMMLSTGDVVHLRPSGNAPELRCYAESTSDAAAKALVVQVLSKVKDITL
jgi:phosphomannomutase